MKRKVKKGSSVPHKKQKSDGNQTLSEGVKQFEDGKEDNSFSGHFNVKLFRKKLNENDFISGKFSYRCFPSTVT